jgi:hypothetical protein
MSGGNSTYAPKTRIERWLDARLLLPRLVSLGSADHPPGEADWVLHTSVFPFSPTILKFFRLPAISCAGNRMG